MRGSAGDSRTQEAVSNRDDAVLLQLRHDSRAREQLGGCRRLTFSRLATRQTLPKEVSRCPRLPRYCPQSSPFSDVSLGSRFSIGDCSAWLLLPACSWATSSWSGARHAWPVMP